MEGGGTRRGLPAYVGVAKLLDLRVGDGGALGVPEHDLRFGQRFPVAGLGRGLLDGMARSPPRNQLSPATVDPSTGVGVGLLPHCEGGASRPGAEGVAATTGAGVCTGAAVGAASDVSESAPASASLGVPSGATSSATSSGGSTGMGRVWLKASRQPATTERAAVAHRICLL